MYSVVAHTDMDGVGAAGLYAHLRGEWPSIVAFAEPYRLGQVLEELGPDMEATGHLAIFDLGINPPTYGRLMAALKRLSGRGVTIEWFDHHVWEKRWVEEVSAAGVKLHVDRGTCTVGVVAEALDAPKRANREFVDELVRGVCAGDLWRFDHWRGGWYMRLIRRKDSDSWRLKVMQEIYKGRAWAEAFTHKVEKAIDDELSGLSSLRSVVIKEVNGIKIVAAYEVEGLENSVLAAYLMSRYGGDVALIASRDGKLSLRSRGVDVRAIALELGGGGHERASGAKIDVPLLKKIVGVFKDDALLEHAAGLVVSAIVKLGLDRASPQGM